jgi:hypothetical protein
MKQIKKRYHCTNTTTRMLYPNYYILPGSYSSIYATHFLYNSRRSKNLSMKNILYIMQSLRLVALPTILKIVWISSMQFEDDEISFFSMHILATRFISSTSSLMKTPGNLSKITFSSYSNLKDMFGGRYITKHSENQFFPNYVINQISLFVGFTIT